jgi:hypothetical protein
LRPDVYVSALVDCHPDRLSLGGDEASAIAERPVLDCVRQAESHIHQRGPILKNDDQV